LECRSSTFTNNSAGHNGGALHLIGPLTKFEDTTIEDNSAYNGGGLYFAPIGKENQLHLLRT